MRSYSHEPGKQAGLPAEVRAPIRQSDPPHPAAIQLAQETRRACNDLRGRSAIAQAPATAAERQRPAQQPVRRGKAQRRVFRFGARGAEKAKASETCVSSCYPQNLGQDFAGALHSLAGLRNRVREAIEKDAELEKLINTLVMGSLGL